MTADVFGLGDMLSQEFMRNAFLAGTAIAVASGLAGYFLVLRTQLFTADALSHVTFTGALAALAWGLDVRVGLFASVVAVSLLLGALGGRGRADDVVIGSVFVWVLGLGVLFLSLFTANRAGEDSTAGVRVLFGSIFGLDNNRTVVAIAVAVGVTAMLLLIARPLLFVSIDESVAAAQGVPVRLVDYGFLLLVGLTTAEATQAIGALLVLALLAAPAAAARRITARPYVAFTLSAALAVTALWLGLIVSYQVPKLPPSFSVVAVLSALYAVSAVATAFRR